MYTSWVSQEYFWNISGIYLIKLRYTSGISLVLSHEYIRHISCLSKAYLRYISGISQVYIRYTSGISQVYNRYTSGISQAYLRHISGIFQANIRYGSPVPSIKIPQPKKTYYQLTKRKYGGTSDLLAKWKRKM